MSESVFVTGASGFVGRHLLPKLVARSKRVLALRRPNSAGVALARGVIPIDADLWQTDRYGPALAECSTVVHLAAATGKRRTAEYFTVNTEGTIRLLEAAKAAGVQRFLFVSTIAATFADRRHYPYAESKARAEDAVRTSGLEHMIVRPTVVLGPGAPAWKGLIALARAGVAIVPGDGRAVMQPIDVEDLASSVAELVDRFPRFNATLELGGPDRIDVETLLLALSRRRGARNPRVVHVPLDPLIRLLALVEPMLLPLLPVTAGQLSAFRYDSTARLVTPGLPGTPVTTLDRMLDQSDLTPADGAETGLARECRVLTAHLTGQAPPPYVVDKYRDAHARLTRLRDASVFDRLVVGLAGRHRFWARLADAYTGLFARRALVRHKLVLLLALLETTGSTAEYFDKPDRRSAARFSLSMLTVLVGYAASLALSLVTILPIHAACVIGARLRPRGSR